jgi:hypothetical protein
LEANMGSYLKVRGWSGSKKVPVIIVAEVGDNFRVEAEEQAYLPGHGTLVRGQSILVPKTAIRFA